MQRLHPRQHVRSCRHDVRSTPPAVSMVRRRCPLDSRTVAPVATAAPGAIARRMTPDAGASSADTRTFTSLQSSDRVPSRGVFLQDADSSGADTYILTTRSPHPVALWSQPRASSSHARWSACTRAPSALCFLAHGNGSWVPNAARPSAGAIAPGSMVWWPAPACTTAAGGKEGVP